MNKLICSYITVEEEDTPTMALKRQINTLQQELREHTEILDQLHSLPEPDAIVVLRQLRSTKNASLSLSSLRDSAYSISRPSDLATSHGLMPTTQSGLQFEPSMLHQSVYPISMPLDFETMDLESLIQPVQSNYPHPWSPEEQISDDIGPSIDTK
jgi:hypothetical protein